MNKKAVFLLVVVCMIAFAECKRKKCKGRDCNRDGEDLETRQERERMECMQYCEKMKDEMQRDDNECRRTIFGRKSNKHRRRCNKSRSGSDSNSGSKESKRRERKPEGCRYDIWYVNLMFYYNKLCIIDAHPLQQ